MYKNISLAIMSLVFLGLICCSGNSNSTGTDRIIPASDTAGKPVGGGCDGCELMLVGIPAYMNATDTSAGWTEQGQHLLLTGTIVKKDGQTPAAGTILYYWQTDNKGYYAPGKNPSQGEARHGHIRGWVKVGADGRYAIYTIRPAPYPHADMPAHIHIAIKEPNIKEAYYIDDVVFNDDPLLTPAKRKEPTNRGGNGIVTIGGNTTLQTAQRNITLGLNIPHYPVAN